MKKLYKLKGLKSLINLNSSLAHDLGLNLLSVLLLYFQAESFIVTRLKVNSFLDCEPKNYSNLSSFSNLSNFAELVQFFHVHKMNLSLSTSKNILSENSINF